MSENSISSSELYKYPELITRSVDGYSFTQELVNVVNNYDFKKNAYLTLSGTNDNVYSYIWSALSSIVGSNTRYDDNLANTGIVAYTENTPSLLHDNIARVFEDNIINYIDNVSNIDVCKVKALQSMILQLGVTYTIFDKIKLMPTLLLNLLDALSIKKEYLINSEKMQPLFALLLYEVVTPLSSEDAIASAAISNALSSASALTDCRLTSVISTDNNVYPLSSMLDKLTVDISTYIDDLKLYSFTSAVYKNVLSDFCSLTYNNNLIKIYADLSTNIMLSDFALFNTNEDQVEELDIYRLKYNIPKEFDAAEELDKIEAGLCTYSDYSVHEQYVLSAEYLYRCLPLSASALYSRYYYYRQRTVRDFFKFVENEYANYLSLYLSTDLYKIDNSYLVVTNNNKNSLLNREDLSLREDMIDYVAKTLADITTSVRDIREQIKTQALRNFLKGTKLHIAYIIQEYIRNNVYVTYKKIANSLGFELSDIHEYEVSDVVININEYADPTEYFNISTAVDSLSDNVNFRFWSQNASTHALAPFNSNYLFKKPNVIDAATALSFTASDILHMYKLTLLARFDSSIALSTDIYEADLNKHLEDFLDAVYDSGADNTYLDLSGNICCNLDFIDLNELTHVKKISDLPLLRYETAIANLNAIYNSLDTSLGLREIVEEYSSVVSGLSDITIGSYNDIIARTKDILEANGKTLDLLNVINVSENITDDDLQWRNYKDELFKKYTGLSIGSTSFYNIKNQRHASYLIHPFVKNFVDNSSFDFPIENIANITSEKIMSLLVNDLSSYIDDDGYLLNVWDSMLNTNSDYLSEYEKSSNKTPLGTTSKQIDYDGLFYPEAVYEFTHDPATMTLFRNTLLAVDSTGKCENKWYRDLNLSLYERENIERQLDKLGNYISAVANSAYDIYRYGKDFYGNSYILVKNYNNVNKISDNFNVSEEEKLNTPGVVWMRMKNHPIAFPMMYNYKSKIKEDASSFSSLEVNLSVDELNLAQIKHIEERKHNLLSNTKFNLLSCVSLADYVTTTTEFLSAVCINDFTISKDRSELFFFGYEMPSDSNLTQTPKQYIVRANIKKQYLRNEPFKRYYYYLTLGSNNNNLKGVDTSDGFDLIPYDKEELSTYKFNCFYNFDSYVGVLAEDAEVKGTTLECSVYMPYWKSDALNGVELNESLLDVLSCENCVDDANEDYKIDITSTKRISIAYRNNLLNNNTLSVKDYLGKSFSYPPSDDDVASELSSLNIITNSISTKDWKFDAKQFIADEHRQYMSYNDMGFVPVYRYSEGKYLNKIYTGNDRSTNRWFVEGLSSKGLLKINLVGPAAEKSDTDHGIFFKHIVPARLHEGYKDNLSTVNGILPSIDAYIDKFRAANYFDAHYTEMANNKYLSSAITSIYDPYKFLQEIGSYDLSLRIDESYTQLFDELSGPDGYGDIVVSKQYLDLFNDVPYLYHCDGNTYENYIELYNPGGTDATGHVRQTISAYNQDEYVILLSTDDYISVSWIDKDHNVYGNQQGIKLDFNTAYYNYNPEINGPRKNYFNWKHCFLNLDKPGDCGYLQIWHDNAMTPGNVYFIKNISDAKPKFIISLSGDFDLMEKESDLRKLLADHDIILADDTINYSGKHITITNAYGRNFRLTIDSISI